MPYLETIGHGNDIPYAYYINYNSLAHPAHDGGAVPQPGHYRMDISQLLLDDDRVFRRRRFNRIRQYNL